MQLAESNELLIPEVFDALPESVLIFKPILKNQTISDFEVVYCNKGASLFLRTPKEKILGESILNNNIIDKQYQQIQFEQCLNVWQTGKPVEDTFYNEKIERYFDVVRTKVAGFIISITKDRTEYYFTEKIRQQEAEKYKSILNASGDGLMLLESVRNEEGEIIDFRVAHCNQAAYQSGNLPADVIGKKLLDVFPHLKESEQFELHKKVIQTGFPERFETTFRKENKEEYGWFIVSLTKLGDSVISVFVDITEKKQNELKIKEQATLMNSILQSSPSGISVIKALRDKDGNVYDGKTIIANKMTEKYTGLPNELFLSLSFRDIDPKIFENPIFQKAVHTLQTGETCHSQYYFNPTGRWLEISLSKMDDDHLINVFTDITIAKEAQLKQEKLLDDLKKSNSSLEEFAYAASHDLQEPLRKINVFSDRLKTRMAGLGDSESVIMFERIEAATLRMRSLIDDLLSYSGNHENDTSEEVCLAAVIKDVIDDTEVLIEERGASFKIDELPTIKGNSRQVRQLFQNLIGNAIKYCKTGVEPLINISSSILKGKEFADRISESDKHTKFYMIEVKDNGIGFEQENAERIFKVFQRLHGRTEYSGTGVGLTIARKVVENHKGYIWAESKPGEGSVFKILFPC